MNRPTKPNQKMTTHEEITGLQNLLRELGIQATSVRLGEHLGHGRHKIVIDWNGEVEEFETAEAAEKEIRAVSA